MPEGVEAETGAADRVEEDPVRRSAVALAEEGGAVETGGRTEEKVAGRGEEGEGEL